VTERVLHLKDDEAALFGYGSLISIPSMERSLGRSYDGPFIVCVLEGWRRAWNIAMPNRIFYFETPSGAFYPERIVYLNIEPDPGTSLIGTLFVIKQSDVDAFDRREWIYYRLDATAQFRDITVCGGSVYVYVGKAEYRIPRIETPRVAAVRRSYLRILDTGFVSLGDDFRVAFEHFSDSIPWHLVIEDRKDAKA
jgi:cation transport regulator ChaC